MSTFTTQNRNNVHYLRWEVEHANNYYKQKYPEEALPSHIVEETITYDWSMLRRGDAPQQHGGGPRARNDGQALRQDMYMKKDMVHEEQSAFQKIEVWDVEGPSMVWGEIDARERWLLLDGVLQVSTNDEKKYHEALVVPALLSHSRLGSRLTDSCQAVMLA